MALDCRFFQCCSFLRFGVSHFSTSAHGNGVAHMSNFMRNSVFLI